MKKIGFVTLGCKVNIYESNALKNILVNKGYEIIEPSKDCDAFIVNTCSVTNMADAKSRRIIHRLSKLNPDAVLCVMGCYSQTNREALSLEGVDVLVGNGNKLELVSLLEEKLIDKSIEKKIHILDILSYHTYEPLAVTSYDHTRAFVKIEDGCENFCTYCIIPYARGPVRSKPHNEVVQEIKQIVERGYEEVVLSGIHTGRYQDKEVNLSDLIEEILISVPKLKRLRLSSIEINEVDDKFLELMRRSVVLADHLHLPIQSGSDLVLSKMERKYDVEFFENKVKKIRMVRPLISITTDVIAGFPYETEEEFLKSYDFLKKLAFTRLHVFPYSMRQGTKASSFPQVKESVKKERVSKLLALSKQLEESYAKQFVGQTVEVIVEKELDKAYMIGHSSNYLEVFIPLNPNYIKKNVKVFIEKIEDSRLYGHIEK